MRANTAVVTSPEATATQSRPRQAAESAPTGQRGQSEPLAALIAVTAVCVLISLYAGTLSTAVGQSGSERRVAEAAMEGIWRDVSDNGVFDSETAVGAAVSPSSIPDGRAVAVEITVVADDGTERTAGSARFGGHEAGVDPPDGAQRATRPIAVQRRPGDIRPGRLVVEVWQ